MESVSSCSPTTPAPPSKSASAPTYVRKPTAPTNRRVEVNPSWKMNTDRMPTSTDVMSRPRDERRDDTFVATHLGDKLRWNHAAPNVGVPSQLTSTRYGMQKHRSSYYLPTVKGTTSWHQQQARSQQWYARTDHSFAQETSFLHHNRPSAVMRTTYDYSRPPIPSQHQHTFRPHPGDISLQSRRYPQQNAQASHSHISVERTNSNEAAQYSSKVVIPKNVSIPKGLSPSSSGDSPTEVSLGKRSTDTSNRSETPPPVLKRPRGGPSEGSFGMLDLLCSATLELGPLQENPSGCSCPKSKCIALYCDCFKAGRRCNPTMCSCLNCKNTVEESGADGARSKVSFTRGSSAL